MEDSSSLEVILKRIKDLADGRIGYEIGALTTRGVRIVKAHTDFILCDLVVHSNLLDENGNWHVGAIATLVDTIANFASISFTSHHHVTLDFSISYYSAAKVQEEVEVEGKVVGKKNEELKSVIVEVRKKGNRELIAMGKLWMAASRRNAKQQTSKL